MLAYFLSVSAGWIPDVHPNPRPFSARVIVGAGMLIGGVVMVRGARREKR